MKLYIFLFAIITSSVYAMEQPTDQWWKDVEFDESVFTHKIDDPFAEPLPDTSNTAPSFYALQQKPDLHQELSYYAFCPSCAYKKEYWLKTTVEADIKTHVKTCDPEKINAIQVHNNFTRLYTIMSRCPTSLMNEKPCIYRSTRKSVPLAEGFNARALLMHHIQNQHQKWLEQNKENLEQTLDNIITCIDITPSNQTQVAEEQPQIILINYQWPEDKDGQAIMNKKLSQEPQEAFYHWQCEHPDCSTMITYINPKIGTKVTHHYKTEHNEELNAKQCKKLLKQIVSPSQQYHFTIPCPWQGTQITAKQKTTQMTDSENNCSYVHTKTANLEYLIKAREIFLEHIKKNHKDKSPYTRSTLDIHIYDYIKKASAEDSRETTKKRQRTK